MANTDNIVSFVAGGAITEYALVSINADGKVEVTTAPTDINVVGVAQRGASAGEAVEVLIHGITRVVISQALTFHNNPILAAAAAGQVQPCAVGDTTFFPVARVLPNINQKSTAGAGEQIKVLFFGPVSRAS